MKTCTKCEQAKPLSEFYTKGTGKKGQTLYYSHCRACDNKRTKKWRDANPERMRELDRNWRRKKYREDPEWRAARLAESAVYRIQLRYGITLEETQELIEAQGGHCALCPETEDLCVDHDHETGEVRGILCRTHNVALGHFNDDTETMRKAITYLEESRRPRLEVVNE